MLIFLVELKRVAGQYLALSGRLVQTLEQRSEEAGNLAFLHALRCLRETE